MPLGLLDHTMPSIDQDNRQVAGRSAGGHISRVLLVAWRVGNDELSLRGREVSIGDVNRDALLAFRLEAVREQGRIKVGVGCTVHSGVRC